MAVLGAEIRFPYLDLNFSPLSAKYPMFYRSTIEQKYKVKRRKYSDMMLGIFNLID
jgi:hypothetical protein